jgi:ATP-dependent RNA helicase HelY
MNPRELAALASTRTYPLRSSFRPSYNMAVNLVHQYGRPRARALLEMSFAQFQADRAVVGLARQLAKAQDALQGYAEAAACDRGDFMAYAALRQQISEVQKRASKSRRADRREEARESLGRLRPGDVIRVPSGKYAGYAVVLDPGLTGDEPRPTVLTEQRQARRLALVDFPTPVAAVARIRVPRGFNARDPKARRDLTSTLRTRVRDLPPPDLEPRQAAEPATQSATTREVARLREELQQHPCHDCPDREEHARWAERWAKLDRDASTLNRRVEQRTNTVARTFDRVCAVLDELGYLDGDSVTERGRSLMRIYSDMDLIAAEALRTGLWDELTPPELGAALAALVFEARRTDDRSPRMPGGAAAPVLERTVSLWRELAGVERDHHLDFLREPEVGFAWAAWRWAEGDDLDVVLDGTQLAAGDFVRLVKQLVDLAGQVADASPGTELRASARQLVRSLRRGVVAYSSLSD